MQFKTPFCSESRFTRSTVRAWRSRTTYKGCGVTMTAPSGASRHRSRDLSARKLHLEVCRRNRVNQVISHKDRGGLTHASNWGRSGPWRPSRCPQPRRRIPASTVLSGPAGPPQRNARIDTRPSTPASRPRSARPEHQPPHLARHLYTSSHRC